MTGMRFETRLSCDQNAFSFLFWFLYLTCLYACVRARACVLNTQSSVKEHKVHIFGKDKNGGELLYCLMCNGGRDRK